MGVQIQTFTQLRTHIQVSHQDTEQQIGPLLPPPTRMLSFLHWSRLGVNPSVEGSSVPGFQGGAGAIKEHLGVWGSGCLPAGKDILEYLKTEGHDGIYQLHIR